MSRFPRLERVAVWAFALAFLALAGTGVIGVWLLKIPLEGYLLLAHVSFGGLFTVSLSALIVFRAEASRFDGKDTGKKICFWLMTIAGLALILSAMLPMFPLLGTEGQQWMLKIHEFSTYPALLAAVGYGILGLARRPSV